MTYHHGNLREALLARAAEVIAAEGIEALSLRALARDLDVSHAAPHRHFADRGALLAELAREGFRHCNDAMDAGAERAGDDPVARYRALGRSYVQFAIEHPSYFRAINHPEVLARSDEDLAEARSVWLTKLREGADAARADGWHAEIDPNVLLAFSCGAAMGTAMLLADEKWRETLGGGNVEKLADAVLDLVVHRSGTPARARVALVNAPPSRRKAS